RRVEAAEEELQQLVQLTDKSSEREVHEQALFQLADLLFHRDQLGLAAPRFERALNLHPQSPKALLARYRLGECHRQLACLELANLNDMSPSASGRANQRARYQEALQRALHEYDQVLETLQGRQ